MMRMMRMETGAFSRGFRARRHPAAGIFTHTRGAAVYKCIHTYTKSSRTRRFDVDSHGGSLELVVRLKVVGNLPWLAASYEY